MFQLFLENFMSPECPPVGQKIRILKWRMLQTSNPFQAINLKGVIWCARKDSNLHRVASTRT